MKALETLQPYFGMHDQFNPPVCQKIMKKSRLEQNIDAAVKLGDLDTAEQLSDRLATRELAVKVSKAASYHRHVQTKEEGETSQETLKKKKKGKNLGWGFEAKQRWETKSNMGYM
ncbi:uncharacterized protein LOC432099 [Xenopus laevis]|uniref:MGC82321 protein n=1 Tax=Xenopus laevis TaxID=8355 RepID=Q6IR59_XENLA|nr:uncharacterized protein LOC432099 [Xenopus laevis]AAH71041.1 MGC82321 protein [Xenopus laevis]